MPAALCPRRRRIYQRYLDGTKQYFGTLVGQPPFTGADADRLRGALADTGLVDALEELLNIYVVYGVARDLQRLAPSKVLFLHDTSNLPFVDAVLPSDGSSPSYSGVGAPADPDVSPAKAYERYFAWYIDPEDVAHQGEDTKGGVEAFFERYPLLAHAVQTVTAHHQANIKLACQRVATDWNAIQAAFFPGRTLAQLVKIRTTGNDFHKGGKQVLILTFLLDDGTRGRVVYKPSAVEIDCRIVGDSDIVNALAPQGYRQDASLTELINKFNPPRQRPEGFTSRPLPTYRILPYNRDSVPDAYGYIEFLTHEPRVEVHAAADDIPKKIGEEVRKLRPADVKASDWIVEDAQAGQVFYHQFGGLMAMAMAVSLSDLHVQNVIAHDRSPHLIDLEEALKKPMTAVADTQLPAVLGRSYDPGGRELVVDRDQTSKLAIIWTARPEPASCVLYLSHGTSAPAEPMALAGPAGSDGERDRRALIRGLVDVIEALAIQECNDAAKVWARGLDSTIARYVTRATQEYAQSGRDLYQIYCESSIDTLALNSGYADFKFRDSAFFVNQVSYQRKVWTGRMGSARRDDDWGTPAPSFAVEHPTHAWRDYLNCDVPSFYHLLGSADLLNSKGDKVDVQAVVEWQDEYAGGADEVELPDDWQANANGAYLPERPVDMVVDQLEQLKNRYSTAKGRREVLTSALAGAGALESNFTRLARGLLVSRPERPVAPVGSEQT